MKAHFSFPQSLPPQRMLVWGRVALRGLSPRRHATAYAAGGLELPGSGPLEEALQTPSPAEPNRDRLRSSTGAGGGGSLPTHHPSSHPPSLESLEGTCYRLRPPYGPWPPGEFQREPPRKDGVPGKPVRPGGNDRRAQGAEPESLVDLEPGRPGDIRRAVPPGLERLPPQCGCGAGFGLQGGIEVAPDGQGLCRPQPDAGTDLVLGPCGSCQPGRSWPPSAST